MKKQFPKTKVAVMTALIATAGLLMFASCSKSNDSNAAFIGTFAGASTGNGGANPDTLVITAGSSSSSIIIVSKEGANVTNSLSASVNGTTFTMPSQSITISGIGTGTVSGSGNLTGNNLIATYTDVYNNNSIVYNFTGTKQ